MPARLPHLLLNGTTGIAVGMATDVPPHNLNEIVSACVRLLDDPDATRRATCASTCAARTIRPKRKSSRRPATCSRCTKPAMGSVRARATFATEQANIVITALPYQVSPSKVIEQIATQMRAKKLPWLEDHARRVRPRKPDAASC